MASRPPRPGLPPKEPADSPSLKVQLATATVPAAALLPLRFFFGATFLYAGFDKLLDPAFFDAASPASIQSQLIEFTRVSPVGGLVHLMQPLAVPMGLAIAIAEIAIGLGALSGLAFRVAAAGGAALSILFWLTASWTTKPFYYGPDLPYAVGWIALALAGTGGLLIPSRLRPQPVADRQFDRWLADDEAGSGIERRVVLQTGLLAAVAVTAASLALPLRLFGFELTGRRVASGGATPSAKPVASGSPAPSATTAADGTPAPEGTPPADATPSAAATSAPVAGIPVATVSKVQKKGTASFTIPNDAPAPLPAGDPGIIVQLPDGTFVAYDAVCTHEGCRVEWDAGASVIFCPCHGAVFDAANNAAVLAGPTNQPLTPLPLVIDTASGKILLQT